MRTYNWFLCLLLVLSTSYLSAVEVIFTDTNGNPLNTTTNKLDLGYSPTAKTVQLWLTYNDTERTTINNAGGLYAGGGILTPQFANIANVFPGPSAPVTNPGNKWSTITTNFNSQSNPTILGATFTQGAGQSGLALPPTVSGSGRFLLLEYLISPGANISSSGTDFTYQINTNYAVYSYGTSSGVTPFNPQPNGYTFTVVPEPTTYVLGAVASGMLGGVGYYRRKKLAKKA